MGRKNRRTKWEYKKRLGFNPYRYISSGKPQASSASACSSDSSATDDMRITAEREAAVQDVRRWQIWFARLGTHPGTSVQSGSRPVLIISRDGGNQSAATVNAIPMTSTLKCIDFRSHTVIGEYDIDKVQKDVAFRTGIALAEQITTIAKTDLRFMIGMLTDERKRKEIERSMRFQFSLEKPVASGIDVATMSTSTTTSTSSTSSTSLPTEITIPTGKGESGT